jgi:hypothetical protein
MDSSMFVKDSSLFNNERERQIDRERKKQRGREVGEEKRKRNSLDERCFHDANLSPSLFVSFSIMISVCFGEFCCSV